MLPISCSMHAFVLLALCLWGGSMLSQWQGSAKQRAIGEANRNVLEDSTHQGKLLCVFRSGSPTQRQSRAMFLSWCPSALSRSCLLYWQGCGEECCHCWGALETTPQNLPQLLYSKATPTPEAAAAPKTRSLYSILQFPCSYITLWVTFHRREMFS